MENLSCILEIFVFFHNLNHSMNFESCDVTCITKRGRVHFSIDFLNRKSFAHETWPVDEVR